MGRPHLKFWADRPPSPSRSPPMYVLCVHIIQKCMQKFNIYALLYSDLLLDMQGGDDASVASVIFPLGEIKGAID